jgi:hypothetical protein
MSQQLGCHNPVHGLGSFYENDIAIVRAYLACSIAQPIGIPCYVGGRLISVRRCVKCLTRTELCAMHKSGVLFACKEKYRALAVK